ncbi:MAG: SusC/RagA family TonB-linked outer membrane protein, partial [Pedobacter sp.]|nr:SusC/RagA family TonB-linked outer membrane protein [Chitinophagaceae bacterium]
MKHLRCLLLMLPLILICGLASAQKRIITGKVIDEKTGEPLVGANILIDKAKGGIATKQDGSYTITAPSAKSTLIFSYVGYTSQIIPIGDKTTIDVLLQPIVTTETEVVVIGYGTVKKSAVTGAVATYKNPRMDESPVTRLDQALQGRIAGVQIQNTSSEAGSDPKIQVRGVSSINAGQSPLVVVDGHPVPDGLAFVNMSDVESVEVLKDAASAAIYGSRGASGVILITTKSGKSEKTKYVVKMSNGYKNPYKVYPIMTTTEYVNLLYSEAALRFADTAWTNYATPAQIIAKANLASAAEKAAYLVEQGLNGGVATDWQQAALRTANVKNIDLSVSGGSKDVRYYISGAYQNDQGMIKHSEYERFNIRSRIDAQLSTKLKLTININPSYFKRERPSTNFVDFTRVPSYLPLTLNESQAAFVRQNPIYATIKAGDFAQPRIFNDLPYSGLMPDGSTFTSAGAVAISSSANNSPYSILETEKITTNDYRLLTSADLTYNILPGLNFKTLLSAYINTTNGLDFSKSNSATAGAVSKGVYTNRTFTDLLNENTLTYTKQIKDHSINILAGFTAQKTRIDNQQISASNFISDNVTTLNTALSIDQNTANTYSTVNKIGLLSYLGRINYSYKNKYLLSASFRADGSSKFAPDRKWG